MLNHSVLFPIPLFADRTFWSRFQPPRLPKYEASKELDKIDRGRQLHAAQQQQQQQQHPNANYNSGGPAHPGMRGAGGPQRIPPMGFNGQQHQQSSYGFNQSSNQSSSQHYSSNGPSQSGLPVPLGYRGSNPANPSSQGFSSRPANPPAPHYSGPPPGLPQNPHRAPPSHASLPPRPNGAYPR